MRNLLLLAFSVFLFQSASAQSKFPTVDKSGMDVSYYPANFPILKIQDKATEPLLARVLYSRPQKGGRVVFGELVEFGSVWRLGANEATEIDFFKDARIGNTKIKKGRYTIYAIPTPGKWTIILNRDTDTWGAFKYDVKKDILRTEVPVSKLSEPLEAFSMFFEKSNGNVNLVIGWDDSMVKLPIYF
ncbi:DUF2911 domain-containing protein [Flavihumibacter rivuli]|uniref:DUF2911 domain-containing protein n=1 Tax=Flavihumibacter rivuli TaxID=2838156 RepID=UPI001BDEDA8E|nr:DUF2911 domain-containing protein [Flavihumibacter rivuli]ULQ55742.1 DUF2911 domain-containing protein [Flavihumibacter rivuli]